MPQKLLKFGFHHRAAGLDRNSEGWHVEGVSTLAEIEAQISALSRAEKAQVLRWVVNDLDEAFPGIEAMPGICGGEARIVRTRIPVWLLVQARRLGTSEADLLRAYPTLNAEDLANAWAYHRAHQAEIDQQIRDNEAGEDAA